MKTLSQAPKRPKIVTSRTGTRPTPRWRLNTFAGPETSEKIVISRTASRPFRRRRENAFSSSEMSKNGHFVNGNPAVSSVAMKHYRLRNVGKMVIPRTASRLFRLWLGNAFSGSETSENVHFANGKPAVSPEARKRFLKLRNVEKWSLRERESGRFAGGEESFVRLRNFGNMVISRTASRPFRRWRGNAFSGSETSENVHFANDKPAVSPVARNDFQAPKLRNCKPAVPPEAGKRFFKLRNVEKWSLRELESGSFAGGEETFFRIRNVGKIFISRTATRPFRRRRENDFSNSETSKNGHFANWNPAVSPVARNRLSFSETSEIWTFLLLGS